MKVLVGCERFGAVRDAFIAAGHDAWSCDLLPSEGMTLGQHFPDRYPPGHALYGFQQHHQCDIIDLVYHRGRVAHSMALEGQSLLWDLAIFHPDCTKTCVSGNHRWAGTPERAAAVEFVRSLLDCDIYKIALEQPISVCSTLIRLPDQYIQPYEFGDDASKNTCLYLKNLKPLRKRPEDRIKGRMVLSHGKWRERWANQCDSGQNRLGPSPTRAAERGKTYPGIAKAMVQWAEQ